MIIYAIGFYCVECNKVNVYMERVCYKCMQMFLMFEILKVSMNKCTLNFVFMHIRYIIFVILQYIFCNKIIISIEHTVSSNLIICIRLWKQKTYTHRRINHLKKYD